MISSILATFFVFLTTAPIITAEIVMNNIAGTNIYASGDDGVIATAASVKYPYGIYCTTSGDIYFADSDDHRIRKIDAISNILSTFAGTGSYEYNGDNIQASSASLWYPTYVIIDETNSIMYLSEVARVRKVSMSTGIINTLLGSGSATCSLNSVAATSAGVYSARQISLSTDASFYVAIFACQQVVKVSNGIVYTIAGTGSYSYNGDNIAATSASLMGPLGVWVTTGGQILISEMYGQRIRSVSTSGIITTLVGVGVDGLSNYVTVPNNVALTSTSLYSVKGIYIDTNSNLYIQSAYVVLKISLSTNTITTIAGTTASGYNGDGLAATSTTLTGGRAVWGDTLGVIYVTDGGNSLVRIIYDNSPTSAPTSQPSISPAVIMHNIAGTTIYASGDDGLIATAASIMAPYGVYCTTSGDVYFGDSTDHKIRKISATSNIISTFTGLGSSGYNGDGIQATSAYIDAPTFVFIDETNGILYLSEVYRVRKVLLSTGIINTMLGSGSSTCSLNSVSATSAGLNSARQVYATTDASIYVAIMFCQQVVKVTDGIVYTIAGTGAWSYNGDNIAATSAALMNPIGVWVTTSGQVLIAEKNGQRIRSVSTSGIITTLVGVGVDGLSNYVTVPNNVALTSTSLYTPSGIYVDTNSNLYIQSANVVLKISLSTNTITTIAGTTASGYNGDGLAATSTTLNFGRAVWGDTLGVIYVTDGGNYLVRKIYDNSPTSAPTKPTPYPSA
eukprot:gene15433-20818_t